MRSRVNRPVLLLLIIGLPSVLVSATTGNAAKGHYAPAAFTQFTQAAATPSRTVRHLDDRPSHTDQALVCPITPHADP
jgi:hypothetical protein